MNFDFFPHGGLEHIFYNPSGAWGKTTSSGGLGGNQGRSKRSASTDRARSVIDQPTGDLVQTECVTLSKCIEKLKLLIWQLKNK